MNHEIYGRIQEMLSGQVLFDVPTCEYTSIGVGGPADVLAFPANIEEMGRLVSWLASHRIPFFPVGNWTNVIVRDGGYRGVMLSLKNLRMVRLLLDAAGQSGIYAEGGAHLSELVSLSVASSLAGLEFCAGIPGSVGGAVKMNAGAYGREMKDVIRSVTLLDRFGHIKEYERRRLRFSYRRLDIPEGGVILAATCGLSTGRKSEIRDKIREIMVKRKGKHPLEYKNAGSIFKNPAGQPAGQIIDALGLKGVQVGDARISEKHGNFIVNTGKATAKDITTLIKIIQERAWRQKGIGLEPEVVIVGDEA